MGRIRSALFGSGGSLTISKVDNLIVSLVGNSVVITWDKPTLEKMIILGYGIKRKDSTGETILEDNTNSQDTTYADNTTAPDTEYEYSVYVIGLPISDYTTSPKITTPDTSLPTDGLQLHIDPSDNLTVTTISGLISQINDKSQNANNAINANNARRPQLIPSAQNGLDVIRFSGSQFLDCGNHSSLNITGNKISMFCVVKPDTLNKNSVIFGKSHNPNHNSPWYSYLLFQNGSKPHGRIGLRGFNATVDLQTSFVILSLIYDGTTMTLRQNGVTVGTYTYSSNIPASTQNVRIGSRHTDNLSEFFDGDMGELFLYDTALNNLQQTTLESHLSNKWGITI